MSPSRLRARLVSAVRNWVHISHSGKRWSTALSPIQEAKLSFSHRSLHQAIVTRSPNHMWAISWEMMEATRCRLPAELSRSSMSRAISR